MIKVKYYYNDDFLLQGFCLKGHADFAEIGYDIVCAAVTSNAIAVINSLDKLQKIEFEKVVGEEGHIECIVKDTHVKDAQFPKNIKILKKQGVTPYVKHEFTIISI